MINYYYSNGGNGRKYPFGNPLANALVVLVGTLAVAASIVLGFIAFVILGSIVLILAAVIGIRVWWFKRQLATQSPQRTARPGNADVIEGEYRELTGSSDTDGRDRQS